MCQKKGWEGGRSTSIWIMSLDILFSFWKLPLMKHENYWLLFYLIYYKASFTSGSSSIRYFHNQNVIMFSYFSSKPFDDNCSQKSPSVNYNKTLNIEWDTDFYETEYFTNWCFIERQLATCQLQILYYVGGLAIRIWWLFWHVVERNILL